MVNSGHKQLRKGRYSQPNGIYLVTVITHQRTPYFIEKDIAFCFCRTLHNPLLLKQSKILAWVVMPDHWHALIQIGGHDSLDRVIARIKATATRNINRITNRTESIWNKTYHDRALRKEDDILPAARYIVANPLRAGLVKRVGDYPYWNAIWL